MNNGTISSDTEKLCAYSSMILGGMDCLATIGKNSIKFVIAPIYKKRISQDDLNDIRRNYLDNIRNNTEIEQDDNLLDE